MLTAAEIVARLGLQSHPEGGYFAEVYRADDLFAAEALPPRYRAAGGGARSASTAIYYLLTPDTFSALHRLQSDEVFHFYLGDPVEMLQLAPEGAGQVVLLGADLAAGMQPQVVVPRGAWQGARLRPGGACGYALLGCTVAPGFDYADFELAPRDLLLDTYPAWREWIIALAHREGAKGAIGKDAGERG